MQHCFMARKIIITEEQLREAFPDTFDYLDFTNDTPSNDGNVNVSTGMMSDDEPADPLTTDDIANMIKMRGYLSSRGSGMTHARPFVKEEVDKNGDGVDDFFNHDELDTLSNGDESDDITRVPGSVLNKLSILIEAMNTLQPKKKAMVINKLIENIDWSNVPGPWRKELSLKILGTPTQEQVK